MSNKKTNKTYGDQVKGKLDEIKAVAVKFIIERKKNDTAVVGMGRLYCDKNIAINKMLYEEVKKISKKKTSSAKDIINLAKKLNVEFRKQKKWTAKQWVDWAKKIKKK